VKKLSWSTPQLVVLSKATPEESVLDLCKGGDFLTTAFADSIGFDVNCKIADPSGGCACCSTCSNS